MTENGADIPREGAAGPAETTVFSVPAGKRISLGAPSLLALPNGKLLAAFDQTGPDVKGLSGKKGHDAKRNRWMQGLVMCSSDGGATWQRVASYPYRRASLFRDGGDVYLLGEASGGLCLMRSPDGGSSWSAPMELTGDLELWLTPTSLIADRENWLFLCLAPSDGKLGLTCWRAPRGASLLNRKAWTQGPVSPPLHQLVPEGAAPGVAMPWPGDIPAWRVPVAVPVPDTRHPWHKEGGLHLIGSPGCSREHWAFMARLTVDDMSVHLRRTASGEPWCWLPLPGGHAKFDLFYDETGRTYWLAGSRGAPGLALGRDAERDGASTRLGLWQSANLVDWTWTAPVVSGGEGPPGVRCDPSTAVVGNDLIVVCRAGQPGSRHVRETTAILAARIPRYRRPAH